MNRRTFLTRAAALPLLPADALAQYAVPTSPPQDAAPGLIVREREPQNLEFNFAALDSARTPNDRFYVRSHFATPALTRETWRLRVEGAVREPLELTYEMLLGMEQKRLVATLECAGNGRVFLTPSVRGVQWQSGAVSTAEWAGVPLAAILDRAGVAADAVEVVLEGADSGAIKDDPKPPGTIHFARSLPLAKARADVLLALQMNGQELPVSHGFPVRAVVPGWYAVASVKWLTRLVVVREPFQGFYQTVDYAIWDRREGLPVRRMITEMQVKSAVARPVPFETVAAGMPYDVRGAAWSGEAAVERVEVSTDGGGTWQDARLLDEASRTSWRRWTVRWNVPKERGMAVVMARATDAKGRTQPLQHDPDRANYMISYIVPIEVRIV